MCDVNCNVHFHDRTFTIRRYFSRVTVAQASTSNKERATSSRHEAWRKRPNSPQARSKQSCSTLPSLLARTTRHLVRKRRRTLHVGSHHTPTQQHRARQLHGTHNTRKHSMSRAHHRSQPNHHQRDISFYSQTTHNSCWQQWTSTMEPRPAPHRTHTDGHINTTTQGDHLHATMQHHTPAAQHPYVPLFTKVME